MKFRNFDLDNAQYSVIAIIGKRGTGKSVITKDILFRNKSIPIGIVMSPTDCCNGFYSAFMPQFFVHDRYHKALMQNIVTRQKIVIENKDVVDPRSFIVLDNCMFDSKWTKDVNLHELFTEAKALETLVILAMAYALGMPSTLKNSIDFVFILRENNVGNRQRLFVNYGTIFRDFQQFSDAMDALTQDFECMVVRVTPISEKIEDNVFRFKANEVKNVKMCNDIYWHYCQNHKFVTVSFAVADDNVQLSISLT